MLNPTGEKNPKLISILPEVATWHAPTLILHGDDDQIVPIGASPRSPTASCAIPIAAITCHRRTSEERSPPFSKKSPDQPAVLAPVDLFDKLIRRSKFTALHSSKNSHRAVRLFIVIGQR